MKDQKRLVPKRRFKEFENNKGWEECKLGELGSVVMNKRIFKDQTSEVGDVPFYKIGTFGKKPDAYISRELFEKYKTQYQYPKVGDVLISASGSIGRSVEYVGKDEYFQDSNIVWLKHDGRLNNLFLKQFYKVVRWEGLEGSTIKRLYNKNILDTQINVPSLSEQQKIGIFFKSLDNLITLQQQKLNKVKALKSAYLSDLFPKEGEKYPKLRFAGFTEAWEERRVDYLANRFDNLRVPVTASERVAGSTPYYGANGVQDFVEGYTHSGEYILIAEDGANNLRDYPVHYVNGKVWVNNHAHVIQAKQGIADNKFLMYAFKMIEIESYLVGGSRAKLNANIMMGLTFIIPVINEQIKIGNFLLQLDHLITHHQRKLEKLQNIKKAYLNELFL